MPVVTKRAPARKAPAATLLVAIALLGLAPASARGSWEEDPVTLLVLRADAPGDAASFARTLEAAGGHAAVVYPGAAVVAFVSDRVLDLPRIRAFVLESHRAALDAERLDPSAGALARAARAWNAALEIDVSQPVRLPPGFVPPPDAGPVPVALGKSPSPSRTAVSDNLPYGAEYYDTSEFLAGSSAVGVWLLEASGATYDWTQAEEDQTLGGVQASLVNWTAKGGARSFTTFYLDIHTDVPVSGVPIENPQSSDGIWVDEFLTAEGWTGANAFEKAFAYNNAIRDTFDTNWAFSLVIVDSDPSVNQGLFQGGGYAWAYYGGPWIYMSRYSTWAFNSNNYWGVVPMHEMGHIYMATDEYDGFQQASGYLNVLDNASTLVACIMNQNDSTLVCGPTRRQLGWRDGDGDDIIEPLDTDPATLLAPTSPDPTSNPTPSWTGTATVTTITNLNPNSHYFPRHDMTVVPIDSVECRADGGPWSPATALDGDFDGFVENFSWTSPPLANGTHVIEARARMALGNWTSLAAADTVTIFGSPVGIPGATVVAAPRLFPAEPNPAREGALFRFEIPSPRDARILVYAADGSRVRALGGGYRGAGPHAIRWDRRDDGGTRVPSGVYWYRLETEGAPAARKLVLLD